MWRRSWRRRVRRSARFRSGRPSRGAGAAWAEGRKKHFADFAPPEKGLLSVLTDSIGAIKAIALLDVVRGGAGRLYSELIQFRPDLSYTPAAK